MRGGEGRGQAQAGREREAARGGRVFFCRASLLREESRWRASERERTPPPAAGLARHILIIPFPRPKAHARTRHAIHSLPLPGCGVPGPDVGRPGPARAWRCVGGDEEACGERGRRRGDGHPLARNTIFSSSSLHFFFKHSPRRRRPRPRPPQDPAIRRGRGRLGGRRRGGGCRLSGFLRRRGGRLGRGRGRGSGFQCRQRSLNQV